MVKKILISIILIIITLMSINLFYSNVYGADTVDDTIRGARDFLSAGSDDQVNETGLQVASELIYNILLAVAIILAIIIGIILGIQFMTASVEEKAKIKETLMAYVAGCVVVFGAFGIWKLAITVLSEV